MLEFVWGKPNNSIALDEVVDEKRNLYQLKILVIGKVRIIQHCP
jgi:hypothetical protein